MSICSRISEYVNRDIIQDSLPENGVPTLPFIQRDVPAIENRLKQELLFEKTKKAYNNARISCIVSTGAFVGCLVMDAPVTVLVLPFVSMAISAVQMDTRKRDILEIQREAAKKSN